MSPRLTRRDRVDIMLAVAKEHEGENMTIFDFAVWCGRMPGERFQRDLSYARHVALDQGHKLSHCAVIDGRNVMVYLENCGNETTMKALDKISRTAQTYTRNTGRSADWEAKHGDSPYARAMGGLYATWAKAGEMLLEGISQFEKDWTRRDPRNDG